MWILKRKGCSTATKLAEACGCRASNTFIPQRYPHFLVNYGRGYPGAHLNTNAGRLNKLSQYEKLREAGVSQPRMFRKGEYIPDDAFPVLARKKYHTQGRDITYIHNRRELEQLSGYKYDFLTEYINKSAEYRVHILGDDAFVSVKFCGDNVADPVVRSHDNGWRQIEYDREWKDELIILATKAIDALGYDFGACDIIRKKDKLYLLEVNSAAGLEPRKIQLYKDYFQKMERKWRNSR